MATSFSTVIERFLPTVTEYMLMDLDEQQRDEILTPFVLSAATQFNSICVRDLNDIDKELGQFNVDLSDEEMDILTDLMRVEWLKHKLYNSEIMRNGMSTKDYTVFSPANLQNQIRETYVDAREDAKMRLYQYSYTHPQVEIGAITL